MTALNPPDPDVRKAALAGGPARKAMAERLRAAGFVSEPRLIAALERVPRHLFVPYALAGEAYGDHALPIGHGQTITQVANVARSIELARVTDRARVLEIGTGSGYQTALLAALADRVYSLERIPELAAEALRILSALSIRNVAVKVFDGTYGWSEHSPYDAIVVSAAAPEVPERLVAQLRPTGRLVIPVGDPQRQRLLVVQKLPNGRTRTEDAGEVAFVPLVGRFGWKEEAPRQP